MKGKMINILEIYNYYFVMVIFLIYGFDFVIGFNFF